MTEIQKKTVEKTREINGIIKYINNAVNDSHYDDYCWNIEGAKNKVLDEYGFDNLVTATAAMVDNVYDGDGRIDKDVRVWATQHINDIFSTENIVAEQFLNGINRGTIHSVLLNDFAREVMADEKERGVING